MRVLFAAWLCLLTLGVAAGATLPMKPAMTLAKRLQAAAAAAPPRQTTTATVLAAATKKVAVGAAAAATRPAVADLVAKALGYVIGAGSMAVYIPIVVAVLQKRAVGFSAQTWVANLAGISLACIYPIKKAFPLSTYVELVLLVLQSVGILGLICHYQQLTVPYLAFMAAYVVAAGAALMLPISSRMLQLTQLAAILVCNYANIPQILLTFRTKQASWSPVTAAMSAAGNLIRIFTTFQLAGADPLVLGGYVLGFATNAILLGQTLFYGGPK